MELWRFTSYLAEPGWSEEITNQAYIGTAALLIVATLVLRQVEQKCQGIHRFNAIKPMASGMLLCITLCLGTQAVGRATFGLIADKATSSEKSHWNGRNMAKVIGGLGKSGKSGKALGGVLLGVAFLCLIGGGYAFTGLDLPLWGHMLAFSLGVGLTEELCKVAVAIILLHPLIGIFKHRRSVLPFVLAGLAFGAVESVIYFQDYLRAGCDLSIYLIRAIWCVLLHVSWTLIVGWLIIKKFKEIPTFAELWSEKIFTLVWVVLPVAALHGIYDAFCVHGILGGVVLSGLASLVFAYLIFDAYIEPGRKGALSLSDVA